MASATRSVSAVPDRRRAPRIPVDTQVRISAASGGWVATAVNASERGLLVGGSGPVRAAPGEAVKLRLELDGGPTEVAAEIVRVEPGAGWVAFRFTGEPQRIAGGPRRRVRKSRAMPREPRPRTAVRAELRSLSALVYEQALMDAEAAPVETLLAWADGLAAELGVAGVGDPHDNRAFLHAMVQVSHDADRDLGG
ncbi:PilZ domain-containing protein [Miltoncostaea marina]|uniref:PilZ domain-containing protein n=1 Tax=Miltoncostaea marina TaxID=2843215 RepID=UPI001C3CAAF3|nr:PilZ domain-containing protein [Miltoncostaea marina]